MGYKTRFVHLIAKEDSNGHVVSEVFLPSQNKWIMIDSDYGAIVRDHSGNWLSIQEIAETYV